MKADLTVNKIFLIILMLGLMTLSLVGYAIMKQEHEQSVRTWQMQAIQKSSAATSSYYADLITNIVLDKKNEVSDIIKLSKEDENVQSVEIVPQSEITQYILETCEVDNNQSFFNQVPTCYEEKDGTFIIYHELRSTGYNLGYLRKDIKMPNVGIFSSRIIALNMALVLICFIFINAISLSFLHHYFIKPIKNLEKSLMDKNSFEVQNNVFKVKELKNLAVAIKNSFKAVAEYQSREKQLEYEAKLGKMASQVAHDIRSPLAALQVASSYFFSDLPEDRRILVRSAIQSIDDIANDLVIKNIKDDKVRDSQDEEVTNHLMSSLIETVVSQKRMQFRSKLGLKIESTLDQKSYGIFAKIQQAKFKRVLSNLINNAVEALDSKGHVAVNLVHVETDIWLTVKDNGKGIPSEILPRVMEKRFTYGKTHGSGLGLYDAEMTVKSWKGHIEIKSEVGIGTEINLILPRQPEAEWFVPYLNIYHHTTIVIFDDDGSIHQVWQDRFETAGLGKTSICHFTKPRDLIDWHTANKNSHRHLIYLCDYELLGQDMTGLDVIEHLNIASESILITSRYEDETVRNNCDRLCVKLIPKSLAGFVPINFKTVPDHVEYVFIDDDRVSRKNWRLSADMYKKRLATFSTISEFFGNVDSLNKDALVYIDSDLGNGVKGEFVAKEIKNKGFSRIFLATGSSPDEFKAMPWIDGVVDKVPPWLQ